jgi:hypothetical protein
MMRKLIVIVVVLLLGCSGVNPDYIWDSAKEYQLWDTAFIPSGGVYAYEEYMSLADGNIGNYPASSSEWIALGDIPENGVITR